MASSESQTTFVDRVQDFVSENKRAILIGAAAVVAVGGVAYYASTSKPRGPVDLEKADKKEKKKSSKGNKKKKTVKDADGPILEERTPKLEEEPGMYECHVLEKVSLMTYHNA